MKKMSLAAALFLIVPVPAMASGSARLPPPVDPAAREAWRDMERKIASAEAVEMAEIQAPPKSMSLGVTTKLYRCWRLQLRGSHGLKVLDAMGRLKSLQDAVKRAKSALQDSMLLYSLSPKPDPKLQADAARKAEEIGEILTAFTALLDSCLRNGLVRESGPALFSRKSAISPLLRDADYVMVYDESIPECPSPEPG
jgi:hypothetical protein